MNIIHRNGTLYGDERGQRERSNDNNEDNTKRQNHHTKLMRNVKFLGNHSRQLVSCVSANLLLPVLSGITTGRKQMWTERQGEEKVYHCIPLIPSKAVGDEIFYSMLISMVCQLLFAATDGA